MRKSVLFIILALVFLVTSCARRLPETPKNPPLKSDYTVAVLPMYNFTNDVGGAQMVRDAELKAPPSAIFEIPEGYTKTED